MHPPTTTRSRRRADVMSVLALLAGLAVAVGLAGAAFLVALCGLFGEQCSSEEEGLMAVLALAAGAVFVAVPVAVAAVRRRVTWLLALPVEAGALVLIALLSGVG